jgi:hypothetical protein
MPYKKLLTAITTTGASTSYTWLGGTMTVTVDGLGTGGVKLQSSPDGGTTWEDVGSDVTFTSDGMANAQLMPGLIVRALVTTASTTGVNFWIN